MKLFSILCIFVFVAYSLHAEDVVTFRTGNKYSCTVTKYDNGFFEMSFADGSIKRAPLSNITTIDFDNSPSNLSSTSPAIAVSQPAHENRLQTTESTNGPHYAPKARIEAKKYDDKVKIDAGLARSKRHNGQHAVGVRVLFYNETPNTVLIDFNSFKLRDVDGVVYSTDAFASGSTDWIPDGAVRSGDKYGGWLFFFVPLGTDLASSEIRYESEAIYTDWFAVKPKE